MPYKSEAQRRKFHVLADEGKISQATVDEFDKASKGMTLPYHVRDQVQRTTRTADMRRRQRRKSR